MKQSIHQQLLAYAGSMISGKFAVVKRTNMLKLASENPLNILQPSILYRNKQMPIAAHQPMNRKIALKITAVSFKSWKKFLAFILTQYRKQAKTKGLKMIAKNGFQKKYMVIMFSIKIAVVRKKRIQFRRAIFLDFFSHFVLNQRKYRKKLRHIKSRIAITQGLSVGFPE